MPDSDDQNNNTVDPFGVGLQIAAGVGLGLLVGWWLDGKLGTSPWCMLGGAMLGLASGMYLLITQAIHMGGRK